MPFESLKRTTRERKYAIDELKEVLAEVRAPPADRAAARTRLEACLRRLHRLKRKLDETSVAEREDAQRCLARLEHLAALGRPARDAHVAWNRRRIDRILVDYLLRRGYLDAAGRLARRASPPDLTDAHVFAAAQGVLASLERRECGEALEWCAAHATRLKKAKSPLEFRLRVQEFVEAVRRGDAGAAIAHARRHLAPWAQQYPAELQRAAALLAFGPATACPPYAALLSEERWRDLEALFRAELFRLHSLPPVSLLEVHLQAGLSALKTAQSLGEACGPADPLHLPAYRRLAQRLPFAKHVHSKLICALTGEVMTEHNPPMALPNGYVYSAQGLEAAAAAAPDGRVVCPNTGASYCLTDLKRVYIM